MPTTATHEYAKKHAQLVELIRSRDGQYLLLSTPASLAWLLGGARTHVSLAAPPIARVLVHAQGCELATSVSEAARIQGEELGNVEQVSVHVTAWYQDLDNVREWFPAASGQKILSEREIESDLRALRSALNETEINRYRALCRDTAALMTQVLSAARSDDSEFDVAAKLTAGAVAQGGEVLVALVSGDSRAAARHPLPTAAPLGGKAMAVLCVRRHGLIANITRWVRFGAPTPQELSGEDDILAVEADILAAIRPGGVLGELLPVIQESYPEHGFDAGEWSLHHQGGIAGYNGRDPRLTPGAIDLFQLNQAFAFNPSAARDGLAFKVEDTMLLTESGDFEVLTFDPLWPSNLVNGLPRPAVLQR